MFTTLIKRNQLLYNYSSNFPTHFLNIPKKTILPKFNLNLYSTKSPTTKNKQNNNNNNNNNNLNNNINNNNINNNDNDNDNNKELRNHYYSNGLIKSNFLINLLKTKRVTFIMVYSWIATQIPTEILYYTNMVVIPFCGYLVYDFYRINLARTKFYELTLIELINHRDKIEKAIQQPFQIPSLKDCKFEINGSITDSIKSIKCKFEIQLNPDGTNNNNNNENTPNIAKFEATSQFHSIKSVFELGKKKSLNEKFFNRTLNINIEPKNKNFKIFENL
ncbi:hypothetical protein ACTFIZ_005676 [Dictyostelium cf. discoideum]